MFNTIKSSNYLFVLILLSSVSVFAQNVIGPPGLSVGTDEVLFKQGVLMPELIGQIISEKQDEVKKEMAKRIILNKRLKDGPYLTYNYAESVLNTLLEHKDKNVIKKALLEHSTELAVVLGVAESYLRIRKCEITCLELTYLDWCKQDELKNKYFEVVRLDTIMKSESSYQFYNMSDSISKSLVNKIAYSPSEILIYDVSSGDNQIKSKTNNIKLIYDQSTTSNRQNFLPKISKLYDLKKLKGNVDFPLQHILTDMFLEICRKNEEFQRLGFFQKNFDEVGFYNTSKYRRFLDLNQKDTNYIKLKKKLIALYKTADAIITTNSIHADLILNLPKAPSIDSLPVDSINNLITSIYSRFLVLKLDSVNLSESDQQIIQDATDLIYYSNNAVRSNDPQKHYAQILYGLKGIMPSLIRLSLKVHCLKKQVTLFDSLFKCIQIHEYLSLVGELKESLEIDDAPDIIKTNLAELFAVLTNLDKAKSYDQVAKLIVDVGQLFPKIYDARIMSNLANLQEYIIVNTDSNRVDVRVEDMIVVLYDEYVKHTSQRLSLHFTVGYNYLSSFDQDNLGDISYASEKIGLKFKLYDLYKHQIYKSRYFKQKQDPILNHVFFLAYGSGLLYQIDALKTNDSFDRPSYGGALGFHFFNGLDFTIGGTSIYLNDVRKTVFNVGFDIPIVEYLSRLGDLTKKQGSK